MLNKLIKSIVTIIRESRPIPVATEAEMDAILTDDSNLNKVYIFTGATTDKYVQGDMYVAAVAAKTYPIKYPISY